MKERKKGKKNSYNNILSYYEIFSSFIYDMHLYLSPHLCHWPLSLHLQTTLHSLLSSHTHCSRSPFERERNLFLIFSYYKFLILGVCPLKSVWVFWNGKVTLLWQSGVEERAMDTWRRSEAFGLYQRTWPWELESVTF